MASPVDSVPSLSQLSSGSHDFSPENGDGVAKRLFHTPKQFKSKWGDKLAPIQHFTSPTRSSLSSGSSIDSTPCSIPDFVRSDWAVEHGQGRCATEYSDTMEDYGPTFGNSMERGVCRTFQATNHFTKFDLPKKPVTLEFPTFDEDSTVASDDHNAFPADAWWIQSESTEREIAALKEFVSVYSKNMMKINRRMDQAKEADKYHRIQIEVLTSRLRSSKAEVTEMEKVAYEQEGVVRLHVKAIETLEAQLETLKAQQSSSGMTYDQQNELMHLRMENDLFAKKIVENEADMRHLIEAIEAKDAEIVKLSHVIGETKYTLHNGESGKGRDELDLKSKVEMLTSKLELERLNFTSSYTGALPTRFKEKVLTERALQSEQDKGDKMHSPKPDVYNAIEIDVPTEYDWKGLSFKTLLLHDTEILDHTRILTTNGQSSLSVQDTFSTEDGASSITKTNRAQVFKGCFGKK